MNHSPFPPPKEDRHPVDEMGKRFAEAGGGLYAAMRAVAVQDQQRMFDLHAKRVCQDHEAMQMAAGFRDKEKGFSCENGEDIMGGDISITGDNYNYYTKANGVMSKALPFLAAALLGSTIPLAVIFAMKDDAPPVENVPVIENVDTDTDTDTVVTVE